jgi:hypothetical protein
LSWSIEDGALQRHPVFLRPGRRGEGPVLQIQQTWIAANWRDTMKSAKFLTPLTGGR